MKGKQLYFDMRDIKFRAWDTVEKKMRLEALTIGNIGLGEGSVIATEEVQTDNPLIWMQYTGTKDKNGVEIYESDILSCIFMIDYDLFREAEFVEVTFEGGRFRPMTDIKRNQYSNHSYYYSVEVVGNIYDNPDILASKQPIDK